MLTRHGAPQVTPTRHGVPRSPPRVPRWAQSGSDHPVSRCRQEKEGSAPFSGAERVLPGGEVNRTCTVHPSERLLLQVLLSRGSGPNRGSSRVVRREGATVSTFKPQVHLWLEDLDKTGLPSPMRSLLICKMGTAVAMVP